MGITPRFSTFEILDLDLKTSNSDLCYSKLECQKMEYYGWPYLIIWQVAA